MIHWQWNYQFERLITPENKVFDKLNQNKWMCQSELLQLGKKIVKIIGKIQALITVQDSPWSDQ